jgi:hypothetical protein
MKNKPINLIKRKRRNSWNILNFSPIWHELPSMCLFCFLRMVLETVLPKQHNTAPYKPQYTPAAIERLKPAAPMIFSPPQFTALIHTFQEGHWFLH